MSTADARYYLKQLKKKYLLLRIAEVCLWTLAAGSLTHALASVIIAVPYAFTVSVIAATMVFIVVFRKYQLHRLHERKLIAFIDQQHQQLEDSADLLVKESEALSLMERLQQQKVLERFALVQKDIKLPGRLTQAVFVFAGSVFITFALFAFDLNTGLKTPGAGGPQNGQVKNAPEVKLPVSVKELAISVTPPAYTGIAPYTTATPQLSVPEGSDIQWVIGFTDSVAAASLVFSAKESVKLPRSTIRGISKRFTSPAFYQIQWTDQSGKTRSSDYYKIEVIRDQAPEISVTNLAQSMELTIHDKLVIDLKSAIKDDYHITDAYIIATVSKGSGESVKFREEKLKFTSPANISGKQVNAARLIDILKLGLEPGDELYFYAEAIDNKKPVANRSRTETFFITLQDTAAQSLSIEGGLGVDLMPEYFRSQRQIIIDTEKLLKDKKKISKHDFNFKSNELGYDQKVLRLKYGEFLGEEFETQIGENHAPEDEAGEEAEDIAAKYGHAHDKDNEHNLVEDKKHAADKHAHGHEHEHEGEGSEDKTQSLMDAYKHQHDDAEEATFFNQSIRSKLKSALAIMWDAELYLRLYEPEKSLPYQYRALKILKEISNDSRIYVHKTGFDPPPLKEEKRLSGDLSEIKSSRHQASLEEETTYPAIRSGLLLIESKLQQSAVRLTAYDKKKLHEAGRELAGIVLESPGQFLETLSMIKALEENEISEDAMLKTLTAIRRSFWQILPDEKVSASPHKNTTHALDRAFIRNLEALKNE